MSFTPLLPTILPQLAVFTILAVAFLLFLRNRIRYDIIALLVMLGVIASGLLPFQEVFANFGHPAIVIVASMFVMSEAFVRSGMVDIIVSRLSFLYTHPVIGLGVLVILVAFISAFVNNAGALAMCIPIAIYLARKSNTPIAFFLLPLAFASHLGGFLTLIGTPRNIIISDLRESITGTPFQMFDFIYVGGGIALLGIIFLIAISWRLIPFRNKGSAEQAPLIRFYTTEVQISSSSRLVDKTVTEFNDLCKHSLQLKALIREEMETAFTNDTRFLTGDRLLIAGSTDDLLQYTRELGLSLFGLRAHEQFVTNEDDYTTVEAVIPPYARLVGQTWDNIPLQKRFGANFIGLFRRDAEIKTSLAATQLWPNDILMLNGRSATITETIKDLQLLPLAEPEIALGRERSVTLTLLILIIAIAIATLQIIPLSVIFLTAALLFILLNLVTLRQAYESIDQTVLILLAGMITLGAALQKSGAAEALAQLLLNINAHAGPVVMLVLILVTSMLISDFMNTTASAVVMGPIAVLVAQSMNVSIDPFLIAVAIGASSAFLTPIGHESNAIVMRHGGYTFKDYFRVGLPLEIIIVTASIPLILHFWPLT